MKYTQATVRATNQSKDAREIAEQINTWAAGAGYAGGFNEKELQASIKELERVIQIGEVMFEFVQHCTRCVMITRDLQTHELNPHVEPFRTLKTHHTNARGKPIFGIHLIPQNSGIVRVGDTLQVIRSEEI